MARPRKEGMDYFPHDTDAVNDTKIEALRMLYGNDGYAFYFILLELIYKQPDFELDVSDAETIQILAKKVEVTPDKFNSMMQTAIKRECFDSAAYHERSVLTSEGVKKRSKVVVDKREKMRQKSHNSAVKELLPDSCEVSDAETGEESTQSKRKVKVKEKESKEDIKPIVDSDECDLSFQEFWNTYPTKGSNKKMSLQKWTTLWKNKKIVLQEVLDGVNRYVSYQNHNGYSICAAQVFLNQERWKDEWVIEEGQRGGYKRTEPFSGGQTTTGQYNANGTSYTSPNGKPVTDPRNAPEVGGRSQASGSDKAASKYSEFVRR
jgi:hypothetical protein